MYISKHEAADVCEQLGNSDKHKEYLTDYAIYKSHFDKYCYIGNYQ